MPFSNILFEQTEGVGIIILNTPQRKNTFDLDTRAELLELLERLRSEDPIKAVVLTGAGGAFSSGGDIRTMEGEEFTALGGRSRLKIAHRVIKAMLNFEKPLIAAVNGIAAGAGVSAAMACDIVIASERARFFLSFVKIGVIPDLGAFYLLPLRIGVPKAKELMLTADVIDAQYAERLGLVNKLVSHDKLKDEALSLAARLARRPSQSYSMIKAAMNQWPANLETFLELESSMQAVAFGSEDFEEGRQAFLEKRRPLFQGRQRPWST